jgi:hypothetical protein
VTNTSENTTDWQIGTADRLDVHSDLGFSGGASYEHDTESRTSSGSPANVKNPIRYYVGDVYGQGTKQFNRLRLSGRIEFRDFNYENGVSNTGGRIYEDDRDRSVVSESGRVEYAVSPDKSVFATATVNERTFRHQLPGEVARDSTGYEIAVGSNFDLSHLLRGELQFGYIAQDYDSNVYKDVSGLGARGSLEYFPTQLTTVTVTGSRTVEDSSITGSSGYLSSNVTAQVDHELLRNVIITGALSYGHDEYKGISRNDDRTSISIGGTYLLNRLVGLNVSFVHYNQDSSGTAAGPSFDVNRIIGSLVFQF